MGRHGGPIGLAPAVLAVVVVFAPARAGYAGERTYCAGPDPFLVQLVPTAHANGAEGTVELRFAPSPFGATVTADGHHVYDALLRARGLPRGVGVLVVWAATPSLDRVAKLGTIGDDGVLAARVDFNKFLVFVTAEESAAVDTWAGPILLRGISPSGRMHTMAGHGPFQGEPCSKWGFGPGAPQDERL